MPTYKKAPELNEIAQAILKKHQSHAPVLEFGVRVDFLFAYCDRDEETGEPLNDALTHHGVKALGIARQTNIKERTKGLGDAEILIDGDWWTKASPDEQEALLDHELHHLSVKITKGVLKVDSCGRPMLRMRKHDIQVGWFKVVADRNGQSSQEQIQAKAIFDAFGQSFWPQLCESSSGPHQEPPSFAQSKKEHKRLAARQ